MFRGWYRQSMKPRGKWHRVWHISGNHQAITTVCSGKISTIDCDFHQNPNKKNRCRLCEKKEDHNCESHRCFAPVGKSSDLSRPLAILELRRLLKPRVYRLRIWGNQGIEITAIWVYDTTINIDIDTEFTRIDLSRSKKKNIYTLDQIQSDLCRFSTSIDWLCIMSDKLALENKRKKKHKGRLTSSEKSEYFEELLWEAWKK